ncbi:MAG: DEAD/DEAH box helicase [Methanosarcinaceae archaeon]|nr:DEAD/DEAH box helicase [Methanosarcinaceae archaeon]
MTTFEDLGLNEPILRSIEEHRFERPTEIQEKAIPLILGDRDVIGGSATGSGKTLAFGAGIIQHVQHGEGIQALVLTPTRELAIQVHQALEDFSRHRPLNIIAVYGGVSLKPQLRDLETADVIVGTPGRVLDHIGRKTLDLDQMKILVLDEADRMLDMGFIEEVQSIIDRCPAQRQTLLFSATISNEVRSLARQYMRSPVTIFAEVHVDPDLMDQVYYEPSNELKFSLLVHLLKYERSGLVMVFCNTRDSVDSVAKNLRYNKIDAVAIHGGLTQSKRQHALKKFHSCDAHALVCTDVAARGLDVPYVSHVYNYDIPEDSDEYVHRIGRTARAGKEGKVINVLTRKDAGNFSRIMQQHTDFDIRKEQVPEMEQAAVKDTSKHEGKKKKKSRFQKEKKWQDNKTHRT